MRRLATTTLLALFSLATLQPGTASASDIVWEVQNPFRFFKKAAAFNMHEKAYEAVRGKADSPLPANYTPFGKITGGMDVLDRKSVV